MIIAAFAGTGKTALAQKYPDEFVDFVCMPYKYELDGCGDEGESGKANPDNILRDDWPQNYVDAILAAKDGGKHLLIPSDWYVLMLLQSKNVPYMLCYLKREAKEEYRRRFLARGNTQDFLDVFIGRWDSFIDTLENDICGSPSGHGGSRSGYP